MPLVWMVSTSLKPEFDVFAYPPQIIPVRFRWQNYVDIFVQTAFARQYLNSLYIAALTVAGHAWRVRSRGLRAGPIALPRSMAGAALAAVGAVAAQRDPDRAAVRVHEPAGTDRHRRSRWCSSPCSAHRRSLPRF